MIALDTDEARSVVVASVLSIPSLRQRRFQCAAAVLGSTESRTAACLISSPCAKRCRTCLSRSVRGHALQATSLPRFRDSVWTNLFSLSRSEHIQTNTSRPLKRITGHVRHFYILFIIIPRTLGDLPFLSRANFVFADDPPAVERTHSRAGRCRSSGESRRTGGLVSSSRQFAPGGSPVAQLLAHAKARKAERCCWCRRH